MRTVTSSEKGWKFHVPFTHTLPFATLPSNYSRACYNKPVNSYKLNIQKTKIMASGPITSWEIDGETATDFILGGSKITADGDWSHEIKRKKS